MADPGPHIIARWISQEIQNASYLSLSAVLELTLTAHLAGRSEEQVADLVERLEADVFQHLLLHADNLRRDGVEPPFDLVGEPGTAHIRAQNIGATPVLTRIQALTPSAFESFCAQILSTLGASKSVVEGGPGDGGVDFIARDIPLSTYAGPALRASYPLVIGQAKKYRGDNLVDLVELRAFLGAALIKADELRRDDDRIGLYSPIAFAFWTTSDFYPTAREFSRRSGLWCLGGLPLAQLAIRLDLPIARIA